MVSDLNSNLPQLCSSEPSSQSTFPLQMSTGGKQPSILVALLQRKYPLVGQTNPSTIEKCKKKKKLPLQQSIYESMDNSQQHLWYFCEGKQFATQI